MTADLRTARRWHPVAALAAAGLLLTTSCASLVDRITEPRAQRQFDKAFLSAATETLDVAAPQRLYTDTGVAIAYRVVEPGNYSAGLYTRRDDDSFDFRFTFRPRQPPAPSAPIGTVILLHGWGADGTSMLPWAVALAERGYRSVIPDLRHHGDSDRAPPGYGPREADDLLQLVPQWRAQGLFEGPAYLLGISYGAVTGLYMGAAEVSTGPPAGIVLPRFAGVVAIAPYSNAADGIRSTIGGMLASSSTSTRWRYDREDIDRAIDMASARLGLDLAAIDTREAAARTDTCTLLIHGARDRLIPPTHSQALAALNPKLHYVELPHDTHVTAGMRFDWLPGLLTEWFERLTVGDACAGITLSADPAQAQPR